MRMDHARAEQYNQASTNLQSVLSYIMDYTSLGHFMKFAELLWGFFMVVIKGQGLFQVVVTYFIQNSWLFLCPKANK